MVLNNSETEWMTEAECAKPVNEPYQEGFFSEDRDEILASRVLCFACPVRQDCAQYALNNAITWGTWGGHDESVIRRALSVDSDGNEIRRSRYPQCLNCGARSSMLTTKVVPLPNGGRWTTTKGVECTSCGFEWRSRTSANAVDAYHAERRAKKARREALKEKGRALRGD